MLRACNSKIYGTSTGGLYNKGSIFEWNPVKSVSISKSNFDSINGSIPTGGIIEVNCLTSDTIDINACTSYTSPSRKYIWYISGIYQDTLNEVTGCNTILTIHLTINPIPLSPLSHDESACEGDTGQRLQAIGENISWYNDVALTNLVGSDSVYTPTKVPVGTYIYFVTQTVAGCESLAEEYSYFWNDGSGNAYFPFSADAYETGEHEVSVLVTDTDGCKNSDTVMITILPFTLLINAEAKRQILMYPNPANDILYIDNAGNYARAAVYDVQGNLLFDESIDDNRIDIRSLQEGMYIIRIRSNDALFAGKFVKQ